MIQTAAPIHALAVSRNALYGAFRLPPSPLNIEQYEFAHAGYAVMTADDARELSGVPGNGARVEKRVRPIRIAAVIFHLPGAVGVHVEQYAVVTVGRIGIFPAQIQYPAIGKYRGAPVMLLVETQLADMTAVRVHPVESGAARTPVYAGHGREEGRGRENDVAVRQIAGVVMVNIGLIARRHLTQTGSVGKDLEYLPAVLRADGGKQEPVRIEMQVHIADEYGTVGFVYGR